MISVVEARKRSRLARDVVEVQERVAAERWANLIEPAMTAAVESAADRGECSATVTLSEKPPALRRICLLKTLTEWFPGYAFIWREGGGLEVSW